MKDINPYLACHFPQLQPKGDGYEILTRKTGLVVSGNGLVHDGGHVLLGYQQLRPEMGCDITVDFLPCLCILWSPTPPRSRS